MGSLRQEIEALHDEAVGGDMVKGKCLINADDLTWLVKHTLSLLEARDAYCERENQGKVVLGPSELQEEPERETTGYSLSDRICELEHAIQVHKNDTFLKVKYHEDRIKSAMEELRRMTDHERQARLRLERILEQNRIITVTRPLGKDAGAEFSEKYTGE